MINLLNACPGHDPIKRNHSYFELSNVLIIHMSLMHDTFDFDCIASRNNLIISEESAETILENLKLSLPQLIIYFFGKS